MVFSFFRKKDEPAEPRPLGAQTPAKPVDAPTPSVARPSTLAPAKRPAVNDFDLRPASTVSGIEVSGGESGLSPLAEEAAILYANGRSEAAIDTLLQGICESNAQQRNLDSWFMLFDLFQVEGMKQEFEKLALDFVVQFERSAPIWQGEGNDAGADPAIRTGGWAYYSLTGTLGGSSQTQIAELQKIADKEGRLRIELGKLQAVEPEGCRTLLEYLQNARKAGSSLMLSGQQKLAALLKQSIEANTGERVKPMWLLLLELYQQLGMETEFDNLSVDYAVAYEVSPPSWEAPPRQLAPETSAVENEPQPEAPVSEESFQLSGVISGASQAQLDQLMAFGAARPGRVRVDMSQVKRVDFVSAGTLLNTISNLRQCGKQIEIAGANEMIAALFSVIGINQFASILRNKQH